MTDKVAAEGLIASPASPLDLEPIKARERKASAGPWVHKMLSIHERARMPDGPTEQHIVADPKTSADGFGPFICGLACTRGKYEREEENALFIAHARTDIPALIAEIERLRAEVSSPARPDFKKMLRDEIACQEGYAASTETHAGLTTPREHRHTASVLRSMLLLIEFREGSSPARPQLQILRTARSMRREAALWPKTERAQQTARMLNSYAEELEQIAEGAVSAAPLGVEMQDTKDV